MAPDERGTGPRTLLHAASSAPPSLPHADPSRGDAHCDEDFPPGAEPYYRKEEVLATGGFAVVFRVVQIGRGRRDLVLKALRWRWVDHPDLVAQVRRSIAMHSMLTEIRHLEEFHDSLTCPIRGPVLVTRHIEGQNLRAVLNAAPDHRLPVRECLQLAWQLGVTIDALHEHRLRVVHFDVAPTNIMRRASDGAWILIDLGCSVPQWMPLEDEMLGYWKRIPVAAPGGHVDYMPPEQMSDRPVDRRVDIYAYACVLYEALTGRMWVRVRQDPRAAWGVLPPDLPGFVREMLERALEMNCDRRLSSLNPFLLKLGDHLDQPRPQRPRLRFVLRPEAVHGRDEEAVRVAARIRPGEPLLLKGAPGMGRAALGREAVRSIPSTSPIVADGAASVPCGELSPDIGSDDLAAHVWQGVLGFAVGGDLRRRPVLTAASLTSRLRSRRMVLLLEDVDKIRPALLDLCDRLRSCPSVCIVATASEPLPGFNHVDVSGLDAPRDPDHCGNDGSAASYFWLRVRETATRLEQNDANRRLVRHVCRLVSGSPQAIRLVVSYLHYRSLRDIRDQLQRGEGPTPDGVKAFVARIPPCPLDLLRSVALFRSPIDWETLMRVHQDRDDGPGDDDTCDLLVSDSARMLLEPVGGDPPRFRVHELMRSSLLSGMDATTRRERELRHLDWIQERCRNAPRDAAGLVAPAWHDTVGELHGDLLAALEMALRLDDAVRLATIVTAAAPVWLARGPRDEARRWLEEAMRRQPGLSIGLRCRLLLLAGQVPLHPGRLDEAERLFQQGLDLANELGDTREARTLRVKAMINMAVAQQRRPDAASNEHAIALHAEAARLANADGETLLACMADVNRASALVNLKRCDEAERLLLATDERLRSLSLAPPELAARRAHLLLNLAQSAAFAGDAERAMSHAQEALFLHRDHCDDDAERMEMTLTIGWIGALLDRAGVARTLVDRSMKWFERLGERPLAIHREMEAQTHRRTNLEDALFTTDSAESMEDLVALALKL